MRKLLTKILKTGTVTLPCPVSPYAHAPNFRGKPVCNLKQCMACGACVSACPSNALTMTTDIPNSTKSWHFNLGRCIFCGRCEEVCPTAAIVLSPQTELAVWQKADLLEQGDFSLCRCRECNQPYAPQKEIDYALSLLSHASPGDGGLREQLETCPACKRKNNLAPGPHVDVGRFLIREGL